MELKQYVQTFARYLASGGVVYLADLGVYLLLISVSGTLFIYANIAGKLCGAALGFFLHRKWTFKSEAHEYSSLKQSLMYGLLLAVNIIISSSALFFLVDALSFDSRLSRIFTDVLVILISYLVSKLVIFKEPH